MVGWDAWGMAGSWSWDEIVAARLERGHLTSPCAQGYAEVVRDVCGLQAQVAAAAELGLGVRTAGLTRAAFRELPLVRTYAMRGTAYLLHQEDVPMYMAAMRALSGIANEGDWFSSHGLAADQADELFGVIAEALTDGAIPRDELVARLRRNAGKWVFEKFDESLADVTVLAAYANVLAYGPPQGSKSTFVLPPQGKDIDERAALTEVVRRYATTYGPVTHSDIGRWLGVTVKVAREAADGVTLVEVDADGRKAFVTDDRRPSPKPSVCLVPQYDAYILGSNPLDKVVPEDVKPLLRARNRGRFEGAAGLPCVLVDGVVAGVWQRTAKRRTLQVAVETTKPLTKKQNAELSEVAERLAAFHEATLELTS